MLTASSDANLVDTVKYLLDHGADAAALNPDGKTALDIARLRGATPIVDLLVKAGAKTGEASSDSTPIPRPAISIQAAIERSIPLLQKTDSIFTQKAGCVSCHHTVLTADTVAAARENGFRVDEQINSNQRRNIAGYLELWRERALQGVGIPGETTTVSTILLGLDAENYKPDCLTDAFARFLLSRQMQDGRFLSFGHRPPLESSEIAVTATSLRSLAVYAPKAQHVTYQLAVKRATDWLLKAQPETTEDRTFQILGLEWGGVSTKTEIVRKSVQDLVRQQHPDGGWSQLPTLSSDAFATGQVLVALRHVGGLKMNDRAYRRGIEFLLKTQLEDGSWYVRSRSIPLQPYFESGFPHGHNQWISTAATNWATTALALTGRSQFWRDAPRRATNPN